jgi:hypothetical protein
MYNMDISLFGLKLNLEVLILIGIIYLVMVSHTVCGCCNFPGMMEAFTSASNKNSSGKIQVTTGASNPSLNHLAAAVNSKEGFTGANTNYGQSAPYTLGQSTPVDPSLWGQQNLVITPGQPIPPAAQQILNRKSQPLPLPEGEMLMFANTPFKPECNSTYSNSSGMACISSEQYNYLILRGGNNVPYSEY